jgi:hypothetical protein
MLNSQKSDNEWDFASEIPEVAYCSNRSILSPDEIDGLFQEVVVVTCEINDDQISIEVQEKARLASLFIDKLDTKNGCRKTPTQQLCIMLEHFSDLVWIESVQPDDTLELCFKREQTIKELQLNPKLFENPVIMTSFERGLKHVGLEVVQTTHNNEIKRWGFKNGDKPIVKEKSNKRRSHTSNDDVYQDCRVKVVKTKSSRLKSPEHPKQPPPLEMPVF